MVDATPQVTVMPRGCNMGIAFGLYYYCSPQGLLVPYHVRDDSDHGEYEHSQNKLLLVPTLQQLEFLILTDHLQDGVDGPSQTLS